MTDILDDKTDVPGLLRNVARLIEQEEFGLVDGCAIVILGADGGMMHFGAGERYDGDAADLLDDAAIDLEDALDEEDEDESASEFSIVGALLFIVCICIFLFTAISLIQLLVAAILR